MTVTSGVGLVQRKDGPVEEIRAGDVVWFPPGETHWHGAKPEKSMTHIAVQEEQDGEAVTWLEHVTDDQYPGVTTQPPAFREFRPVRQAVRASRSGRRRD